MVLGVWGNAHANPGEIGASIAGDQGVSNSPHQPGETQQSLGVLTVRQEAVALQDGRLHVAKWLKWKGGVKSRTKCVGKRIGQLEQLGIHMYTVHCVILIS